MKQKKLNLLSGTSYAIGSLIGSGVLFLPSLTFEASKTDVILSWCLATFLCIPLIIMFYDMSKTVGAGEGIKGYIEKGLGSNISSYIPILMLSTVIIGMPSSALIVGKFVHEYSGISGIHYLTAALLLGFGIISNYMGKGFGAAIQKVVSLLFIFVSVVLFCLTFEEASSKYDVIKPTYDMNGIFSGIILAFWAFAGFESLSFVTNDFENPEKDFLRSMIIALIVCGLIYLGITLNYVAIIPIGEVKSILGIFQLSESVKPVKISTLIITIFSVLALSTNFNSWVRGLSQMIRNASEDGTLPAFLSKDEDDQNRKAILFLGSLFLIVFILQVIFPSFLKTGLIIVSSNFVLIYVIFILSYLKTRQDKYKKVIAFFTLLFLLFSLVTSQEKLLYPFIICLAYFVIAKKKMVKG